MACIGHRILPQRWLLTDPLTGLCGLIPSPAGIPGSLKLFSGLPPTHGNGGTELFYPIA